MKRRGRKIALGMVVALSVGAMGLAAAHSTPGGIMSPGMMGSQQGMGPGMMSGMMPCPMMGGTGTGMTGGAMSDDLTPEQHEEMRRLMQEHRPTQFERMGELMNLRENLMAQMNGPRPDPNEIQALHDRMAKLQGEMLAERVRLHNALHDVLTEEQRERLLEAPSASGAGDDHATHH